MCKLNLLDIFINFCRENSGVGDKKQEARETGAKYEHTLNEVQATLTTKKTDLMHLEENKGRIVQEHHNIKIDLDKKNSSLSKYHTYCIINMYNRFILLTIILYN